MKGYFKIKILFVIALLSAIILYVGYLYFFRTQSPDIFTLREDCNKEQISKGSVKANAFFDQYFDELISLDPEWQSQLGIKDGQDKWTSISDSFLMLKQDFFERSLQFLNDSVILCECLDKQTAISAKLLKSKILLEFRKFEYRLFSYPVNQMYGVHTKIPAFLINVHKITDQNDALAYIQRVKSVPSLIDELIAQLKVREKNKIILPAFLFPAVIGSVNNIIGASAIKENLVYTDFVSKINALSFETSLSDSLKASLTEALSNNFLPSYQKLQAYLSELKLKANNKSGVWKWEKAQDFYAFKLQEQTSTDLSPQDIYQLGLDEVARIQNEMKSIMAQLEFDGSLQDFFSFMREDKQFYYPNNAKGKEQYLYDATNIIDSMRVRLDELFISKPKAELTVKAVEAFREKSAGKAFYESPAPDGSRPGTYYANTYNMAEMPKYQMEALAYHEAIPGHHMQLSLAQELTGLPKFRRLDSRYIAYIEGWGLYSEYLPKEIGFYQNPYSDFGRLAMELWRACRMVVDVGIHHHKWNRQKAIDYYKDNTPNAEGDCIKMVDRHIVMPAQATTYKVGMITIIELKQKAEKELGDKFDIRKFHEVLLTNGAVPLHVLQDLVEEYIQLNQ